MWVQINIYVSWLLFEREYVSESLDIFNVFIEENLFKQIMYV